MDLKYMLLGTLLVVIVSIPYTLWPIFYTKYKLHKKLKEKKKRQIAFINKMKELEIK